MLAGRRVGSWLAELYEPDISPKATNIAKNAMAALGKMKGAEL
jgi:hypothetical protein